MRTHPATVRARATARRPGNQSHGWDGGVGRRVCPGAAALLPLVPGVLPGAGVALGAGLATVAGAGSGVADGAVVADTICGAAGGVAGVVAGGEAGVRLFGAAGCGCVALGCGAGVVAVPAADGGCGSNGASMVGPPTIALTSSTA
ncbi:hypothetical protein GCM10022240_10700 [Microbacterium kribbense]|uniref:Uncharacterized protein n=1 Tax=Microbacterium kribbense TaxID=433645 RepID=A0ABP7GBI0_9MICO